MNWKWLLTALAIGFVFVLINNRKFREKFQKEKEEKNEDLHQNRR